ncbi:hypothetical protein EBU95_18505, partial [bacterium]|nr:hypothetical protein [bacterium]
MNFQVIGQTGKRVWQFQGSGVSNAQGLLITYTTDTPYNIGFEGVVSGTVTTTTSNHTFAINAYPFVKVNSRTGGGKTIVTIEMKAPHGEWGTFSYNIFKNDTPSSTCSSLFLIDYSSSAQTSSYLYDNENNSLSISSCSSGCQYTFQVSNISTNNIFCINFFQENLPSCSLSIEDQFGNSLMVYDGPNNNPFGLNSSNFVSFIYIQDPNGSSFGWAGPRYVTGDSHAASNIDFSISYDASNNNYYYNLYQSDSVDAVFQTYSPEPSLRYETGNVWNYEIMTFFQSGTFSIVDVGYITTLNLNCSGDASNVLIQLPSGYSLDGSGITLYDSSSGTYQYNCQTYDSSFGWIVATIT